MNTTTPARAVPHFEALDGWRGVCACMVVLYHFPGYSPVYTSGLVRNSYLFVDFFFVLSGFVIALNYSSRLGSLQDVKRFLILRAGRLYPLHLFMLLCFVLYETAKYVNGLSQPGGSAAFTGGNTAFSFFTNLFLVQSLNIHDHLTWNGPSWSISTEWWTYVIFALLCAWVGLRNWMLLLAAIAAPLLLLNLSGTGMDTTYDYGLLRCVFGFALGVACHRIHTHRQPPVRGGELGMLTLAECAVIAAVAVFVSSAGTSAWSILAPFIFAVAVLVFALEGGLVSRLFRFSALKWLGKLSYSIYLTHLLFVLMVPPAVKRILHQDPWTAMPLPTGQFVMAFGRDNVEGTLYYLLVLALTLAFSVFTYRWVETPGREWSRRWLGRPQAALHAQQAAPMRQQP